MIPTNILVKSSSVFKVGDLVRINESCLLEYFEGMLGVVMNHMGEDNAGTQYYKVKILEAGTKAKILNHASVYHTNELELVNRGKEQ